MSEEAELPRAERTADAIMEGIGPDGLASTAPRVHPVRARRGNSATPERIATVLADRLGSDWCVIRGGPIAHMPVTPSRDAWAASAPPMRR